MTPFSRRKETIRKANTLMEGTYLNGFKSNRRGVWTGFFWLRTEISDGLLLTRK
jgi:hypothetical protein